ncbi:nucleotidyl transferase AbiEii/AbiGii toxin family protein, partial [candidate division KSB1 bacterium]|nr:nucleotidyl transferase AbiEii/AbiGii toxin family protein [candidate division KSB1 bacterium]
DFSLLKKDSNFSLSDYCSAIEHEVKSFGFSVSVEKKDKQIDTAIDSAFIKAGTLKNMIYVDVPEAMKKKMHPGKIIKIKLEVDKDPPGNFETEAKYLFQPIPFSVNTFTPDCLFAGKMHAILCRAWKTRVKGRDWYDLVWYTGRDIPVCLNHLESRLKQTGHLEATESLTKEILKKKLQERINSTDFVYATRDVETLLKDPSSLKLWSKEFFNVICEKISTTQ